MFDKNVMDSIANALWVDPLKDMDELDIVELAKFQYAEDPDVQFIEIDFIPDAGVDEHGVNDDEEMEYTWSDYAESSELS